MPPLLGPVFVVLVLAVLPGVLLQGVSFTARNELELKTAMKDNTVDLILLDGNITMTPSRWPNNEVIINRTLEIRPRFSDKTITWAVNNILRGSVVCKDVGCKLTIRGQNLFFTNNYVDALQGADQNQIPTFLAALADSTVTLAEYTTILDRPNSWFTMTSNLFQPSASSWVGPIKVECISPTEMIIDSFNLDNNKRNQFFFPNSTVVYVGFLYHSRLRLQVLPNVTSYVWTETTAQCQDLLNVCNNYGKGLPGSCGLVIAEQRKKAEHKTVGLAVGLGAGIPLLLLLILALAIRRRRIALRNLALDEASKAPSLNGANSPIGRLAITLHDDRGSSPTSKHTTSNGNTVQDINVAVGSYDEIGHIHTNGGTNISLQSVTSGHHLSHAPLSIGNPLGVQLQELLGKGAYGSVYKALYQDRAAAVKIIQQRSNTATGDLSSHSQLTVGNEAVLGLRLEHPNVLRTLSYAVVDGADIAGNSQPHILNMCELHIVMELCGGGTLKDWLIMRTTDLELLPEGKHFAEALQCLIEMSSALEYLHREGVIHGDLKCHNVLLATADKAPGFITKLADFGYSQQLKGSKSHTTLSKPGGTISHIAPELLSTSRLGPPADVYAFGIMMWEVVTCKTPFDNMTVPQIIYAKTLGRVDDLLAFPDDTPAQFITLARRCWSHEPTERPPIDLVCRELRCIQNALP